ncbi:hypothetical protein SDC9_59472 [bioreactor metagenome]|uniref:Uncharacterized protein n=1 Tax=bioreactor metagenome TaxID=1076179 RepID=A0A644XB09_9ZZZZ
MIGIKKTSSIEKRGAVSNEAASLRTPAEGAYE